MHNYLCLDGLAFASRQNELIELALTYKFGGIEIDMDDMASRAEAMGNQFATQFINSSNVQVRMFRLPIDFGATEDVYQKQKARLPLMCELADSLDARCCYALIPPASDTMPFQENFDNHRQRISEVAEKLKEHNISLGLGLQATAALRIDKEYPFVAKAEELIALVNALNESNVGYAIDTFHWVIGDGAMDQIESIPIDKIYDIRLADVPSDKDPAQLTNSSRIAPGENPDSICNRLIEYLSSSDYTGAIGIVVGVIKDPAIKGDKIVESIRNLLRQKLEPGSEEADVTEEGEAVAEAEATPEAPAEATA